MKNWVKAYYNLGIRPKMDASLIIRTRLLNVLNLSCLFISLIYAWINSSVHEIATLINLLSILVNLVIFGLLLSKRNITAFFVFLLLSTSIGASFAVLFGQYIASDLLFCTGIAYSIAIFDNRYRMIFGVVLNAICFVLAAYFYENYNPVFTDTNEQLRVFYYPNTAVFLITLFVLVFMLKNENQRYEKTLKNRNKDLAHLNHQNEVLLKNILPASIAKELKEKGEVKPQLYKHATVMFTDFYHFTQRAEKVSAIELVNELDTYFSLFDRIISSHGIEKLKTIGDAYMCVTGIPIQKEHHAIDMVKAALEIMDELKKLNEEKGLTGKNAWEIRIGIHTGQVVAGIIGKTKFAFDIWGDTVNIASRMETSSDPGRINISQSTYNIINNEVNCTYRGKVEAKNKGEMNMYFVDGLKN